ncbi:stage II sporulation protein E [Clostridium sp. USBA 49]|uniref:stage II sporulation protein E n=1 Tax=Clostridium TaxID=1485 RepID=UPI0009998014|nr:MULTISPECIES: stage II sporulation protein E [Clostridium]SKA78698.1 stage II sporulation protein E [Clostridium sp. USBA 49]
MQYGANLTAYERAIKTKKNEEKKVMDGRGILKLLLYFLSSFLISRVLLINYMAPFGIAFLIAVALYGEEKLTLISGCGSLIGYATLYGNLKDMPSYMILIGIITLLGYLVEGLANKKKIIIFFSMIFLTQASYKMLISNISIDVAFFTAFFETTAIFPIYFIINYSIICLKEIKTKHLFTNEEIVSMAITCALIVSGTWGAEIFGISLRNLFALIVVLMISYVKGSTVGAASGAAMGIIVGICSNNMEIFISVFTICGLIAGTFKETGKILTGLSYIAAFFIVNVFSNTNGQFKFAESIITLIIFFIIPNKFYARVALELDFEKKYENISSNYVDKIKSILVNRLDNFSQVLSNMSIILENLAENDKLVMKNKSAALIENLADRVCSNCNMNSMCWKRESYYTYNAFAEIIQNYEEGKGIVPDEIDKKCVKRTALVKNTEEIVNNYIISEMWRKRLSEGRELLSSQISNMASSVSEIIDDFSDNIKIDVESENNIRRILDRNKVEYKDVFCLNNKNNRLIVKLKMNACGGSQLCIKDVLPYINEALNKNMSVSDDGCNINPTDKTCNVTFEETPKFHIASYAKRLCKDGESYSGDSYTFGKLQDGSYMTVLSDGMGSGPQAEQESNAAVELIEKFASTGFNRITAINTVNSIMSLKFSAEEKFSTVDVSSIDLYTGEAEFMKVGAVASFIKSGNKVEVIKSRTLPMGVLDKVDIDIIKKKVKNGDIIVMLTDGVLDYNSEAAGRVDWVVEFLENTNCSNPKDLVEELIENAKKLSDDKIKDDMTAVVSKVYSLY